MNETVFILGSRSPRRLELLRHLISPEKIKVQPPSQSEEASFENHHTWKEIESQLKAIAEQKNHDVLAELPDDLRNPNGVIITADTIIVGEENSGQLVPLGKPPNELQWKDVVRSWFQDYYAGKPHYAATALSLQLVNRNGIAASLSTRVVRSTVQFIQDVELHLDWYLSTEESIGKAGGYAIQGAGSLFVESFSGSLSNIVGLPLRELQLMLWELGIHESS